jgi:hypothetical protein
LCEGTWFFLSESLTTCFVRFVQASEFDHVAEANGWISVAPGVEPSLAHTGCWRRFSYVGSGDGLGDQHLQGS